MNKITTDLLPLAIPIMTIKPDPMNARTGHALDELARSLDIYGQVKPIVVNAKTKQIEAGNGTYQAAKNLGWSEVAAVMVNHDSSEAIGYAIADNKLTDLSHFDDEILLTLLQSLDEPLEVPGIDDAFMAELLDNVGGDLGGAGEGELELGEAFGKLPTEDREPFQQMIFTLHDSQVDDIKDAIKKANDLGVPDSENKNGNGNALHFICKGFLNGNR